MAITFLTDKDAIVRYDEQTLTDEQKTQARVNIGAVSLNDIPSSAIIDVAKLPTEDIDEHMFYRLLTGTFVYNQYVQNNWTCYTVSSLPEVGEAVTIDMANVVAYYNAQNGNVYGYINDALSVSTGTPVGWYPLDMLAPAFGLKWGGILYDILDDPKDDTYRLLLEYVIYSYKDGWASNKIIGSAGIGPGAEVFNHPSNIASGSASHAEGFATTASGSASHAEGNDTNASGSASHAEGNDTNASGNYSHAEGYDTNASGSASHAEGYWTTASGKHSHAEGHYTTASGEYSHAEGHYTTASGEYSHAEGENTVARAPHSHVQGKCNIEDSESRYAHIVGNGNPETGTSSNAHTLDWDGNAWYQGEVYVGGVDQDNGSARLLKETELPEAINTALAQAKASGEFDGKDGVSASHSWNGTVLTVTSASGTSSVDLKGDKGDKGDSIKGDPGSPGADGVSPTVAVSKSGKVTTISITDKNGTKTATVNDGADGSPGKDGTSVTVSNVSESTASGGTNVVTFSDGKKVNIKNGKDGTTPVKGTDYFTAADKAEMVKEVKASMDGIPAYWQAALDEGVVAINTAVESAGRNKSAFFFYTDAHWGYGSGMSPKLLKYMYKHTGVNKTIFGGDFGNTYEHPDTGKTDDDWMDVMRTWKLAVRDIPNHHSVVGNHDKDIDAISTDNRLYGFLFAPEESNDIVRGGDFFYYIDDVNEKTRYFYLNTGLCNFSDEQCAFLIEHLTSVPAGWHIVAVSHIWFVYDDTSAPTVGSVPPGIQQILNLLDAYNARETGTMTVVSEANNYDFSACEGWVEFCIGGHTHVDYNFTSESGIPVILCQTDSYHTRGNYTFTQGTTTESAVSGIVADYDAKKISVIRVGRGESSDIAITTHVVTYTNVIKTSIDKDGNIFNGGKGWADNSRIGSGGIYLGNGTAFVTGHIPVTVGSDLVIRLRNVTFDGSTHNNYMYMVAAFDAAFARVNFKGSINAIYPTEIASNAALYSPVLDGTNIVEFKITPHILSNTNVKYIAICCSELSDASIITINEPID